VLGAYLVVRSLRRTPVPADPLSAESSRPDE
jgi:hypothetical protein